MTVPASNDGGGDPFRVLGSVVAKHKILRLLGEGGMGSVYEGEHVELGERRALKFCAVWGNASIKQRAVNEAKIGASIRHPGICHVYDFEWGPPDGTTPVVVMELLKGRTLLAALAEAGRLPWQDVFRIMLVVCDALAVAHARGVIHRDIKPENIFLTDAGPKVVDFGIAKMTQVRTTRTGAMMGTPHYMSPEQVTNSKNVDARADVYSCGVTLFQAVSGTLVYPNRSGNEVLVAILQEPAPRFKTVAPNAPDDVSVVIDRCLAKVPTQRYQSALELKAALESSLIAGRGAVRSDAAAPTFIPASESSTPYQRPLSQSSGSSPVTAQSPPALSTPSVSRTPRFPKSSYATVVSRSNSTARLLVFVALAAALGAAAVVVTLHQLRVRASADSRHAPQLIARPLPATSPETLNHPGSATAFVNSPVNPAKMNRESGETSHTIKDAAAPAGLQTKLSATRHHSTNRAVEAPRHSVPLAKPSAAPKLDDAGNGLAPLPQ